MAIADHPKFAAWLAALDDLKASWDGYNSTRAFKPSADPAAAEVSMFAAMRAFNVLSEEVGA